MRTSKRADKKNKAKILPNFKNMNIMKYCSHSILLASSNLFRHTFIYLLNHFEIAYQIDGEWERYRKFLSVYEWFPHIPTSSVVLCRWKKKTELNVNKMYKIGIIITLCVIEWCGCEEILMKVTIRISV